MGQKNLNERPLAVTKAYAYARAAQGCGHSVKVEVKVEPAEYYSSGEIMWPSSVLVWLTTKDEYLGMLGDRFMAGWRSYRPGQGRSATTRFIAGSRMGLGKTKDFRNERDFAIWLTMDSYRREEPAKYGIVPEDSRITAPEWSAEDWGL